MTDDDRDRIIAALVSLVDEEWGGGSLTETVYIYSHLHDDATLRAVAQLDADLGRPALIPAWAKGRADWIGNGNADSAGSAGP